MSKIIISGFGLGSFDLLTLRVLNEIKKADIIFIENYTGLIPNSEIKKLEKINKNIKFLTRDDCELNNYKKIFDEIKNDKYIVFLTEGDPLLATTHVNLIIELEKNKINYEVIPSIGIICSAISLSGLQVYRIGEILTFPIDYKNFSNSIKEKILKALNINKHVIVLFEMDLNSKKYVTPKEFFEFCVKNLENILNNWVVVLSSLGLENQRIFSCRLKNLSKINFNDPPYTVILVSNPHIVEKEFIELIQYRAKDKGNRNTGVAFDRDEF